MFVFPHRVNGSPTRLIVYNERLRPLVRVAALTNAADLASCEPPSDTKSPVGHVLEQAFREECTLADIAIAASTPPEQLIKSLKRTIPGTSRLERL